MYVGCHYSLDWTTGLEYWTGLSSFFGQIYVCIFSVNLEALFKNFCHKATVMYVG